MTRDRDEKRLVRAKAERERTSYVEARRRFDRSSADSGIGSGPSSGGHLASPIRTTPIMQRLTVADITLGLISLEEQRGHSMLRMQVARHPDDRWMIIRIGDRRFERPLVGNGLGSGQLEWKGHLDHDADMTVQVSNGMNQAPTGERSVVLRPHPNPAQVIPYVEPASYDWKAFILDLDAQGAHPQSIDSTNRPMRGLDEPQHFITSIEHWASCSVLNVYHDDPAVQGTLMYGFFGAMDSKGRRYESWGGEGGTWGNGMTSRHWMIPRIASDAEKLMLFRRRAANNLRIDKAPFATVELK